MLRSLTTLAGVLLLVTGVVPAVPAVSAALPTAMLRLELAGADGGMISEAGVTVSPHNGGGTEHRSSSGVFAIALTPGGYSLRTQALGYQPITITIMLPAGGLDLGVVVLERPGKLGGTLLVGTPPRPATQGEVTVLLNACADGRPASCDSGGSPTTSSGADGRYELTLGDGHYRLEFAPKSGNALQSTVRYIRIAPAERDQTLDVSLPPTRTLSGTVYLGDRLHPAGAGEVTVGIPDLGSVTYPVDAQGRYVISGLSDSPSIVLHFQYAGVGPYMSVWSGGSARRQGASSVRIASDEVYDQLLPLGGVMRGTVVTADGSSPEGITVKATRVDLTNSTESISSVAADGSWEFRGLGPGNHSVVAFDERVGGTGGRGVWGESPLLPGGSLISVGAGSVVSDVHIAMRRLSLVQGLVLCEGCGNRPRNWRSAYLVLEMETDSGWTRLPHHADIIDVPGDATWPPQFDFRWLYPATYRLALQPLTEGFELTYSTPFAVADGGVTRADVTFSPAASARDFSGDGLADVLGTSPPGAFYLYRGDGRGGWKVSSTIGAGWSGFRSVFSPGDFDGDGAMDVVARDAVGRLWLYSGDGAGGWRGARQIGVGWQGFTALIAPGDFDGDGAVDVIARAASGVLYLYSGDGAGGWAGARVIGSGWSHFDALLGPGDFDGDGNADVVARLPNGDLWLYRGSGDGGWRGTTRIGIGWSGLTQIATAGDFDGDGAVDIFARTKDGLLLLYRGDGTGGWRGARVVGSGWGQLSIVG